jgi:hypothetical protein
MSVPEREEEAEGWKALHNGLYNLYAASKANTMIEWQSVNEHPLYHVWQRSEMHRKFNKKILGDFVPFYFYQASVNF